MIHEATDEISITMQAQEWNVVLGVLGEEKYRIVAGLIGKITTQAQATTQRQPQLGNGADRFASLNP